MSSFRTSPGSSNSEPAAFSTWPVERQVETKKPRRSIVRWLILPLGAVIVIGICFAPLVVFAQVFRQAGIDQRRPSDAIVVLGAAQFNGIPSQVFRARLDTAYDLYEQGYSPWIVVTGGRAYGDQYTEAEAGRNYLVDRGVPTDAILMENVSHNTAASFEGVRRLLKPRGIGSLLLVSDGFHLHRSKLLAADAGFDAWGVPAADSPIHSGSQTELRYMVRETFGVLAWKLHLTR